MSIVSCNKQGLSMSHLSSLWMQYSEAQAMRALVMKKRQVECFRRTPLTISSALLGHSSWQRSIRAVMSHRSTRKWTLTCAL